MTERATYRVLTHKTLSAINARAIRHGLVFCLTEEEIAGLDTSHGYVIVYTSRPVEDFDGFVCEILCETDQHYTLDIERDIFEMLPGVDVEDRNPVDYHIHVRQELILEYVSADRPLLAPPNPEPAPPAPERDVWGVEEVEAWECQDCEHIDVETSGLPLWECRNCGQFAAGTNRCPECGLFSSKVADDSCVQCDGGMVVGVRAWMCLHCNSIHMTEDAARDCCPPPAGVLSGN